MRTQLANAVILAIEAALVGLFLSSVAAMGGMP